MSLAVLHLRQHSLVRGTLLVTGSLLAAFLMAGWPDDHASMKMLIPTLIAFGGAWDTFRCMELRWTLYTGGVLLLLYMDVMAISMILFLFLYPYGNWIM